MPRRSVVAALSVLLGIGVASHAVPDSVDASTLAVAADQGSSYRLMPTRPERGHAWIEGTVVNRAGRFLDGIDVEAYDVDDLRGDPVASWQTYEDPEGGPEHGWFRLYGLTPGTYELRFSSAPGTPRKVRYRSVWSRPVTVGNREIEQLGSTAVTLVTKVPARLTASLTDATVRPSQAPLVRVGLTAAEVRPVLGS
ncbi:carboxypeptidase-like regulatory domain-containing protein, partial [Nocardioides hankookensis]